MRKRKTAATPERPPLTDAQREAVVLAFRHAVAKKVGCWDACRDIEKAVGVELDLADTIESFAVSCDSVTDALSLSENDIVKAVLELADGAEPLD